MECFLKVKGYFLTSEKSFHKKKRHVFINLFIMSPFRENNFKNFFKKLC